MVRCQYCAHTKRKAKGESWKYLMCKDCYRLTDHYTHDARWQIADYVKLSKEDYSIHLNIPTNNTLHD